LLRPARNVSPEGAARLRPYTCKCSPNLRAGDVALHPLATVRHVGVTAKVLARGERMPHGARASVMTDLWKKWTAAVPAPFLTALLLGAGYLGFVAWDQSHWWQALADYTFGWLAPLFVAFVVHDRWPRIRAALAACGAAGSARARGVGGQALALAAYGTLAGGAVLFLLGATYRAGAGASQVGSLALTMGASALLLATLFVSAPEPDGPAAPAKTWTADARVRLVALFVFPALVWLVSAPMVSVVERNLSGFLLTKVMRVVYFTFDTLGLPVQQQGNVLVLPEIVPGQRNEVGVADACSGIRSLTGCLFAGSFLAAVFLEQLWKKILLVGMAAVFAFGMNLLRALFLTGWAYRNGSDAIHNVHDIAGYAVLGLTVAGLLCLLPLFNLKVSVHGRSGSRPPMPVPPPGPVGGGAP
jgi:exosortase/archaeosortase family protein